MESMGGYHWNEWANKTEYALPEKLGDGFRICVLLDLPKPGFCIGAVSLKTRRSTPLGKNRLLKKLFMAINFE
ncbi:MAG: hypothetical protein GY782_07645 [Gammaproteobacteria bacterium]|nr:hypothetical protein [Gammaproteobacteria bacterium]